MAMKKDSDKKNCDKACSMAIFAAVALVGVSQLLTETDKYEADDRCCCDGSGNCLSPPGNCDDNECHESGGNACYKSCKNGTRCNYDCQ